MNWQIFITPGYVSAEVACSRAFLKRPNFFCLSGLKILERTWEECSHGQSMHGPGQDRGEHRPLYTQATVPAPHKRSTCIGFLSPLPPPPPENQIDFNRFHDQMLILTSKEITPSLLQRKRQQENGDGPTLIKKKRKFFSSI